MSRPDENRLHCPVCRAGQVWRDQCRRCQADLRLLTRALRHHGRLVEHCRGALDQQDGPQARAAARRLLRLRPGPLERRLWHAASQLP